jgi:hypothetical protein
MQLSITFDGKLVRQGLQDLSKEIPEIGRRKIYDAMNRITRNMEGYPPERPRQTYVRTGRLGRRWNVKRLDEGYTVSNSTPYTKFVVGSAYGTDQAWMHVGRWQLFRDVVDMEVDKLPQEISDAVIMVARRKGFETTP